MQYLFSNLYNTNIFRISQGYNVTQFYTSQCSAAESDNGLCAITHHCTAAVLTGTCIGIIERFGLNSHSLLSRMITEFPATLHLIETSTINRTAHSR